MSVRGTSRAFATTAAAVLLLAGCNTSVGTTIATLINPPKPPDSTSPPTNATLHPPDPLTQIMKVTVVAPAALGNGTRVVADQALNGDASASATASPAPTPGASGTLAARRTLAQPPADLPVQNAVISLKTPEFKIIPSLVPKFTDADGTAYFKGVPAHVLYFLQADFQLGGKAYTMFGLARGGDLKETSSVTIDLATTLTVRLMLRIRQRSNYFVSFKDISYKDYQPLIANLEDLLANSGLPSGVGLNLSAVHPPDGVWSLDKDRADDAVVALDGIAQRYANISLDVQHLYDVERQQRPSDAVR